MPTEFLSESSVAEFFDTSQATVRRWVDRGVLPKPLIIGGVKRWPLDELRTAARRGLDAAVVHGSRSADPDQIAAEIARNGRKNRKANARRRLG